MPISHEDVEHVAKLARLQLSAAEVEQMAQELGTILDYVARLDSLDLDTVDPNFYEASENLPQREDEPQDSLPQSDALENAPDDDGCFFIVPRVV
ncbi:MAG: Asp-tRNA(Asn)/Glu-tRNA(Gln) amidotransferase GatCAB subunit C [Myxococcales bacterium]|nr:Asp-tRNA(Asn)/Glu-tRNA(Gln) amidotransferase GatCAB subunit C [Myxococcales bacterium]